MKNPVLTLMLAFLFTACGQTTPAPEPVHVSAAPTLAAAPCHLLMITEAAGVTAATIGPACPDGAWVEVHNAYGHSARSTAGMQGYARAGAGPGPVRVVVSAGVSTD